MTAVTAMIFCDKCGSRVKETVDGYACRKCGKTFSYKPRTEKQRSRKTMAEGIYLVNNSQRPFEAVSKICPACRSKEAFHTSSSISGEHAGVKQERTLKHFKCARCSHTWVESS